MPGAQNAIQTFRTSAAISCCRLALPAGRHFSRKLGQKWRSCRSEVLIYVIFCLKTFQHFFFPQRICSVLIPWENLCLSSALFFVFCICGLALLIRISCTIFFLLLILHLISLFTFGICHFFGIVLTLVSCFVLSLFFHQLGKFPGSHMLTCSLRTWLARWGTYQSFENISVPACLISSNFLIPS